MERSFPSLLDSTVIGFSVNYWTDPEHKYLFQHSPKEPRPCFQQIHGVREEIDPPFDPNEFYQLCLKCVLSTVVPEAGISEYPSMDIGIAFESVKIYANVPIDSESLENQPTQDLKEFLEGIAQQL